MRKASVLLLVLAVLGSGCSKPEANLIGKWQMDSDAMKTGNAQTDAMAAGFAKSMVLEFKADKTYTMAPFMEGIYVVNGHSVTLTATKAIGMDISKLPNKADNKPQNATLSEDGKSLTINTGKNPMKFVKAAASGS